MRIGLVSDWFLPRLGGIELQVRDLAVRLGERGHEVEVITPVPGPESVDGIRVHRLGTPRLPMAGIVCTAGAFRRMRELLASGRYDLVHVHFGIVAPAAYGATRIAQSLDLPTVASFHSVLRGFAVPAWLVRGAMGVADWRVKWSAVSSVVAASMRPLVADADVAVLPNAVDVEWWARPPREMERVPRLRMVSVMRLHARKRPRALIRAFARLARRLPAERMPTLRIVGDGPQRRSLEALVAREKLDDVVAFLGWLPQPAVRDELHRADAFVLPSCLEAFGIAALEARCAGLPVVTMAESGARDFLTHGVDALLARSDEELVMHLEQVVTDADLLARLTRDAVRAPRGLDWAAVLALQEALYSAATCRAATTGATPGSRRSLRTTGSSRFHRRS